MPKTTLTNQEIVDLANGLHTCKDLKGVSFALVVAKNLENIQKELQHIDDASKPTEKFLEVAGKIQELTREGGKEEEIQKIEEDNKSLTEERKKQLDEVAELLKEESTIDIFTVYPSKLPEDITADQVMKINRIIIDN